MQITVAFHTLGCKVNRYETDAAEQAFRAAGYEVRAFDDVADVYVINTCTVTGEADRKSRQFLRQAKTRNPDAVVVAMGCHVELCDASAYADILIGTRDKLRAVELTERKMNERRDRQCSEEPEPVRDVALTADEFEEMGAVVSREETRAYIKVEDGCNRFCSYCAIPLARGRVRSRAEAAVLRETEGLAENGFQEIVLTGIHVCSYGLDRGQPSDALIDLCAKIAAADAARQTPDGADPLRRIRRIRLGSLEPQSLTDVFISKAAAIPQLCPHFHVSLQSGSDSVLRRMNRLYTTQEYAAILQEIRRRIPRAKITTDIITGFPGETEEEHRQTVEFCRSMDFLDIHVFKFSERKGTRAASMEGKVDARIVAERSRELLALARGLKREHLQRAVGERFEVLVEKVGEGIAEGYTENYIPAKILLPSAENDALPGSIVTVRATGFDGECMIAVPHPF